MIYTLDLARDARNALVRSKESNLAESVLPSFWADKVRLEIDFVEPANWVGDAGAVLKARIGVLPDTYLVDANTAVWDGRKYIFELDFNNTSFDTAILNKLELKGFFELQLEFDGRSRTLLQQSATFRNSFLSAGVVNLTIPSEPSLPEAEVQSPPNAPSIPIVDSSPRKPSSLALDLVPNKPQNVLSANFSIRPLAPSLPEAEERLFPPSRVHDLEARIFGTPNTPSVPNSFLVLPTPLAPEYTEASLVTIPVIEEVTAFEVVEHSLHNHHHKYLYFETNGGLTNRLTGSIMQAENKPFVFTGVDSQGAPTYLRESPVELIDPETGQATNFEHIKLKRRADRYIAGLNPYISLFSAQDALLYNPEGYNLIRFTAGDTTTTEYTPKNLPSDWQRQDYFLYEIKVLLAYQYNTNTSTQPRPNTLEVTAYTQELFPHADQLNKLGYKHYGGRKISYLTTQAYSIKNASDSTRAEFADAGHSFTFSPAYSGLTALPPALPSLPEAEQILPIQSLPTQVEAIVRDFDINRYSPSLWLDASQEEYTASRLGQLQNYANTNYEVFHYTGNHGLNWATQLVQDNGLQVFDFSSTRTAYTIPQNVFGTHFEDGGKEIEIYLAYKPFDYDPEYDPDNIAKRAYNPHIFVNRGGDQRFTCHAPHTNGSTFYFDAGRTIPTIQSRVSGSKSDTLNKFNILGLRASVRGGLSTIFHNGDILGEKPLVAEEVFMNSLSLGGWGTSSFGQSMYLCEVLLFRNKLEDAQREKVEGYLAHKWGIANRLASTHPYKNTKPDNYGEFRRLDPFPKKPFVFAEAYPNAPSSPLSGFGSARPSDVEAGAYPNAPTAIVADDIPPLRFLVDATTEISAINNTGLTSDLGDIEAEIKDTIERIQVFNTNSQREAVTFTITNNNTGDISPAVTSVEDGIIETFVLNAVENKPYLSAGETGSLSFSIRAEDSQGEYNVLPVQISLTGVSRTTTALANLEDIQSGAVFDTSGVEVEQEPVINNEVNIGYPDNTSKYIKIAHTKNELYTFDLRVVTPDKSGADLYIGIIDLHYRGRYYQQGGTKRYLAETITQITQGSEIYPDIKAYGESLETYFSGGRYVNRHNYWYLITSLTEKLPIKIRCTNVTEVIPDVEKVYSLEVEFLTDSTISNAIGYADNDLHKLQSRSYHGEPDNSTPQGRRSFWGYTAEEIANDFSKGFSFRFLTAGNQQLVRFYPVTYELTQPSSVVASVGARVWAKPSLPEAFAELAKFPVDLNLTPRVEPYNLGGSPRYGVTGSWDRFHFVDPDNKRIGYDSNAIIRPADPFYTPFGNGTTWVWSANFSDYARPKPTFIHYTQLNNIRVDNYPEPVIQKPHRYPFDWYLVDTAGNKTNGQGVLDPITQQKLLITEEKIITFPSGKKIITEFGGYVCTSGKVKIRVSPAGSTYYPATQTWSYTSHNLDYYTEFTCELGDLGAERKNQIYRWYSDNTRKLVNMPDFTLPVKVTKTHTGQTLPVPETKFLSHKMLRMAQNNPTIYEREKINPSPVNVTKEFASRYEASFLFHNETQFRYENEGLYTTGYKQPSLWGANETPLLNYAVFTLGVHVEASDFIAPEVHPKWGRKYSFYSDNQIASKTATNSIVPIPKLPSHTTLQTSLPNKLINYAEWEFIQNNKPANPSNINRARQITYKDLTPHRTKGHDELFSTSAWRNQDVYFIIPRDGTADVYLPFGFPSTQLPRWYNVPVFAGDVYRVFSNDGSLIRCQREYRIDGKNPEGARYITLRPSSKENFIFNTLFQKKTASYSVDYPNNFYLKQSLINSTAYQFPSSDPSVFTNFSFKYFKLRHDIERSGFKAGDIVKLNQIKLVLQRGNVIYVENYTRTEQEYEYWKEYTRGLGYEATGQRIIHPTWDNILRFDIEREEEGQRPDNYKPPAFESFYLYDYGLFFHWFEPYEYARTYREPEAPKEFEYLGEPLTKAYGILNADSYRPSTQILDIDGDRVEPENLNEFLLDPSNIDNKEQNLFFRLSEAVGNYPAGQYFRILGTSTISVPSGISPYLLDSEGNIQYTQTQVGHDVTTGEIIYSTTPVPNPNYIATYTLNSARVIPTGNTARPVEQKLYTYNQGTYLFSPEDTGTLDLTGKVYSPLYEITESSIDDMVLNRYYKGVRNDANAYFIRTGEEAIFNSDTANADLAQQNKFIVAKADFGNFRKGKVYKMQHFRSEQSSFGSIVFNHYGEFYEMDGDKIAGNKFTINLIESELLRTFYQIVYAKESD